MTIIRIRERGKAVNGFTATVSFDDQYEYSITINDPFSAEEEARLEWYFEQHLKFPFTDGVKAKEAAASITRYGEALFNQIFVSGSSREYNTALQHGGPGALSLEIAGSPEFHRLHWEALKDPHWPDALALHAPVVRKNLNPSPLRATVRPSPTINVLIVTARPHGARDVGYRTISRPLVEALRQANLRVQIEILRPGAYLALKQHLEEVRSRHGAGYYHVIHFDVHGAVLTYADLQKAYALERFVFQARPGRNDLTAYSGHKAFLFLEGEQNDQPDPVEAQELAERRARRAYYNQTIDLQDWLLPVVYQTQPLRLTVRELTPEEASSYFERQAQARTFSQPTYGFVGRDLDILHIEKRLLTRRNLLLVRGMGGAGKTTLLQHLADWWRTTRFVEHIFYFGYDDKAWNCQQILAMMGERLLSKAEYYATFQPLSLPAQQEFLAQRLRAQRNLLILDNLESITGAPLAIQNTLPPDQQAEIRGFLARLLDGKTLVLLGSRGGEEWLAKDTFGDNLYELPGLDPEAASTLAERILERQQATRYRQDEQFLRLLKLLDGYPLALEIVLANLARQTPAEVLTALQAGDINLDTTDSRKKTESILRCIDYSHSNLSRDAQGLLACLAPFSGVIYARLLPQYTEQLKQQPALAHLPFDRWAEVLQEAANWGLLSPEPDDFGFLHLQPIFPYFLRSRLQTAEQEEARQAVEAAFRGYYDESGGTIRQLQNSKEPREKQLGQVLVEVEYENFATALTLALQEKVSIFSPYVALSNYLDTTRDQQRGLLLGEAVLEQLKAYPTETLAGPVGAEFAVVIDDIANRQLSLKRYSQAEASYQEALSLLSRQTVLDKKAQEKGKAGIYHQLGSVAQEQRQWEQAAQYYEQALAIYVEYNDRYRQASTLHNLGVVAQEQRQWEQARDYLLRALEIFGEYKDYHNLAIALRNLARLWQASADATVPAAIAEVLQVTAG